MHSADRKVTYSPDNILNFQFQVISTGQLMADEISSDQGTSRINPHFE